MAAAVDGSDGLFGARLLSREDESWAWGLGDAGAEAGGGAESCAWRSARAVSMRSGLA